MDVDQRLPTYQSQAEQSEAVQVVRNTLFSIPQTVRPIVIVGAGGIVREAHLPAYKKASFPVVVLVDSDLEKARQLAAENGIPLATRSLEEAMRYAPSNRIFDIAVPASALLDVLHLLPDGAAVLMQKPMGNTLKEAEAILSVCRRKGLIAAVNFQLRWAPTIVAAMALNRAGILGSVHDMEVQVNVHTPWGLWVILAFWSGPAVEVNFGPPGRVLATLRGWGNESVAG